MTPFPRKEVLRQLDLLRGGVRVAESAIRKLKTNQNVDSGAVLRILSAIRFDAEEVRNSISPSK